jgi:hypothetical protein
MKNFHENKTNDASTKNKKINNNSLGSLSMKLSKDSRKKNCSMTFHRNLTFFNLITNLNAFKTQHKSFSILLFRFDRLEEIFL